jgi:hypothetical protein
MMGFFNGWNLGNIAEPIKAVGDLYTTDKARIDAQGKYEEIAQKTVLAQISNNAILAASSSLFNSGWQPLIGWTCGFLVFLYYAPQIIIMTYVWGVMCIKSGIVIPFPMKPDDIFNLIWLLFGFGGYSLGKRAISKI